MSADEERAFAYAVNRARVTTDSEYGAAWRSYLAGRESGRERRILMDAAETRDVTEAGDGGYLAPRQFSRDLLLAVREASAFWRNARLLETPGNGAALDWPLMPS